MSYRGATEAGDRTRVVEAGCNFKRSGWGLDKKVTFAHRLAGVREFFK